MTRNELQTITDERREHGQHPASDPALMVLMLMDRQEVPNYCRALRVVMAAFPEIDRETLETELDRFI